MTDKQQLHEAIFAGERALAALSEAKQTLGSAKGWGLFDLLGGGLVTTMIKRGKMRDARSQMDDASAALAAFQRELLDVQIITELELEDDAVLAFTDYVFDDFLSDLFVQRKIGKALDQIEAIERQVSSIVEALRQKYKKS